MSFIGYGTTVNEQQHEGALYSLYYNNVFFLWRYSEDLLLYASSEHESVCIHGDVIRKDVAYQ